MRAWAAGDKGWLGDMRSWSNGLEQKLGFNGALGLDFVWARGEIWVKDI